MNDLSVQTAQGSRGVVASGHAHATDAALAVLQDGGNAVDAAVCAAFVLAVVCPYACTLGGDLYALVYEPGTNRASGLNGTGRSPLATDAGASGAELPRTGGRSATVPGLVRAAGDLLARFGTRALRDLLAPALRFAADGFAVSATFAANTAERAALLAQDPAARALFLPHGAPLAAGARFVQDDLAQVLHAIAADGPDAFYAGELAARIVAAAARANAPFTPEDLARHTSLWQSPLAAPFYGCEVWTMPPNSYGPTLLLQLLDLEAGRIDAVDPHAAAFVERGYEARRRAYARGARWIADPAHAEEPMRALLAEAIAGGGHGTEATRVPAEARDRCTTNAIVIDRAGLAVSLVASISAPYGSGVVLAGTGIVLNNRMAGFSADRAHANSVGPAKRPANTLAPCLVTRGERLLMSLGTPGTVGQTCTLAQFLARVLACGEAPAAAIAAPRWSVDFAGRLVLESSLDAGVRDAVVAARPQARTMPRGWISFGSIKCAVADDDGVRGFADDRRSATTGAAR